MKKFILLHELSGIAVGRALLRFWFLNIKFDILEAQNRFSILAYMDVKNLFVFTLFFLLLSVGLINSDLLINDIHGGKCTGRANCTACSSCNYCKHCNSGGSCGVCGGGSLSVTAPYNRSAAETNSAYSFGALTTSREFYVNTDQVNVRSGPGAKYSIVGKMSRGKLVAVSSTTSSTWIKITYATVVQGHVQIKTGYVGAQFLSRAN